MPTSRKKQLATAGAPRPEVRKPPVGSGSKSSQQAALSGGKRIAPKRVSALPGGYRDPVQEVANWLRRYVALPPAKLRIVALWVVASWLAELWDRFGHLAVTSPEKRCGKTLFLTLLALVLRGATHVTGISPAALFRLVENAGGQITLLIDEAQSLNGPSEASQALKEMLNAAIDKHAGVPRCVGLDHEPKIFHTYCPKVIARIGDLDSVLADRCLAILLERKTAADRTERVVLRVVEKEGEALQEMLEEWCDTNRDAIQEIYEALEPLPIENYRMADILLPLQAVATFTNPDHLVVLEEYAHELERAEAETDNQSAGVLLLKACREILSNKKFIKTEHLLTELIARSEEPWATYRNGRPITARGLSELLKLYHIRPEQCPHRNKGTGKVTNQRGYHAANFASAWSRYCPPLPPQ